MNQNRKKNTVTESEAEAKLKGFLDMIAPSVIQFHTDHYICGNTYRSVWALREYSGQGKSYLLKLILTILRESGMKVICLDPEHEYIDLTNNLGGCFVDLMSGEYIINVLEPKTWDENGSPEDTEAPEAFRCSSRLSQHISFLKDFFRTYKNFTDSQIR